MKHEFRELLTKFEKFLETSEDRLELGEFQEVYDSIPNQLKLIHECREMIIFKEENPWDIAYGFTPRYKNSLRFGKYSPEITRRIRQHVKR